MEYRRVVGKRDGGNAKTCPTPITDSSCAKIVASLEILRSDHRIVELLTK
jgi:hypothetical protein